MGSGSRAPVGLEDIAKIKQYVRRPDSFPYLRLDPYSLESEHWELRSSEVLGAIKDLDDLNHALEHRLKDKSMGADIQGCVIDLWPTLVLWLDFLHPVHHAQTDRKERVPLQMICRMFFYLFNTSGPIASMRSSTSSVYDMLFLLWLRFDEYQTSDCDAYSCLVGLAASVRHAMWIAGKGFAEHIDSPEAMANYPSIAAQNIHPACLPAALGAVGHRPRRLFRQLLKQTNLLIRITLAKRPSTLDGANDHVIAVGEFANELLPQKTHSRDVVVGFVDLLRSIRGIPNLRQTAFMVCSVLHSMWRSSVDGRPLAWAIRRGVMESLVKLYAGGQTRQLSAVFRLITMHVSNVCVVRALYKSRVSFQETGWGTQAEQERLDKWLEDRAVLLRLLYAQGCARGDGTDCSYGATRRPRHPVHNGEISPRDERFVVVFTEKFMRDHAYTIVVAILEARKREPPVDGAIELVIGACEMVPKVAVIPRRSRAWTEKMPEDTIPVFASISYAGRSAIMEVTSTTFAKLKEIAKQRVAEGYYAGGLDHLIHKPVTVFKKY
ncbi:hypothetical protein HDZ31DRAFT_60766 [Schizophyllum fasciatum]